MNRRKLSAIATLCLVVILGIGYAAAMLYKEGQRRDENVMRYARMIDTSAEHRKYKGTEYFNTYGYFVDRETGLHFTDDIGDSLYRQFARDGNKAIEVSWRYSVDKREQTSLGIFYIIFAGLIYLGLAVATLFLIGYISTHWKGKQK